MARPSRSWVRKTYTVSPEVERAVSMRAGELGIDTGTVLDILAWNALLKPTEASRKPGGLSRQILERMFAEEVLALLENEEAMTLLRENWVMHSSDISEAATLRTLRTLIVRWRRTRHIDKDYQGMICTCLADIWIPSILRDGLVDEDWFQSS